MRIAQSTLRAVGWLACLAAAVGRINADEARTDEFFEKRVRPVLAGTCFRCHGGQKVSGGLRVDGRDSLLKGGDTGAAIDVDQPESSRLVRAIRREDDVSAMPPDRPLEDQQVKDFVAWIQAGAPWPQRTAVFASEAHWAFQPIRRPAVPEVNDQQWSQTAVDRFILAKLEPAQLKPSLPAERHTLIRRVTYGLTGLPPSPDEVTAFETDRSPHAFEALVERLLQSTHYGEHWGRHWLDVVRYADTAGENSDHPLPHAWRYRNWVIKAFNNDQPYDQFVREQMAGDLLAARGAAEEYGDRIVATGYLAIARRFGHDIDKDMHLTHEDVIDNLGKTFLGLSLGCCRCHDHKYDPLTTRDYYGLYGIFGSTRFAFPGCEPNQQPRDLVPLWPAADKNPPAHPTAGQSIPVAYAVVDGTPQNSRIHLRGDPTRLGEEVPRKFLDVLGGERVTATQASGRLELAEWLTQPTNPLTARVMVNRIWQWHFGRGLVATPNDFGTRGVMPTHPELLDYLADEFIRSGWSIKSLQRLILQSATYQQASGVGDSAAQYAAFSRRRLTAEELRDTLLVASGELDPSPGRSHPFPPESTWSFTQHGPFAAEYETFKRSAYMMQKRNRRSQFFALFDGPDPNASTPLREVTTVPTQALFFLNDPFFHARAEKFARRILAAAADNGPRLDTAMRWLVGRRATQAERADADLFLREYSASSGQGNGPTDLSAWQAYARILLSSNEVLHVD